MMQSIPSSSRCYYVGCGKRPTYGVDLSRRRESCAEHARPGLVNIDLTRYIPLSVVCSAIV